MPILQTGSHEPGRKGGNRPVVPTVMVGSKTTQVYLQNGNCFGPTGKHIPVIPDWVIEQMKGWTKDQLARLGFDMKFGKPVAAKVVEPKPIPVPPVAKDDDEDEDAEE